MLLDRFIQNAVVREQAESFLLFCFAVAVAIVVLKLASFMIRKRFEGNKDRAEAKEMASVYQYTVYIAVIFLLVVIFSNIFRNALASIGILAAGLAIALQRPILNVFGWITVVMKKPFMIGDRISIGQSKGDVFEINIMHTLMSELQDDAPSGRMIAVPNEFVLTQPITNYTKGTPFVWDTLSIVVDKDSDEREAREILGRATMSVVGRVMRELSRKWSRADGHKVSVESETSVEIVVVNGVSAIQLTSRYLCNVKERKLVRSMINDLILEYLKSARGVKLK